jgi:hypothetical protein
MLLDDNIVSELFLAQKNLKLILKLIIIKIYIFNG